jgi:hypothetical protein
MDGVTDASFAYYGVKIVLMFSPGSREDYSRNIHQVAADVGVRVWALSPPGRVPAKPL